MELMAGGLLVPCLAILVQPWLEAEWEYLQLLGNP